MSKLSKECARIRLVETMKKEKYTLKDLQVEIEELQGQVKASKHRLGELKDKYKRIRCTRGVYGNDLFDYGFKSSWRRYTNRVRDTESSNDWVFSVLLFAVVLFCGGYWAVKNYTGDIPANIKVSVVCTVLLVHQAISMVASFVKYLWIPSIKEKDKLKTQIKDSEAELGRLTSLLQTKIDIEEAKKLADLRPEKVMDTVRNSGFTGMLDAIQTVRNDMVPEMASKYAEGFSCILNKCEQLVALCEEHKAAQNEISSIYNIYVNEVASVLVRGHKDGIDDHESLEMLISNFETYVDRKIEKYTNMKKSELSMDVNVLNSLFTSESGIGGV